MSILKLLDHKNLHHAYLIEGAREEIVADIFEFIKGLGINPVGNADVSHISLDSLKVEDARSIKSLGSEKSFSFGKKFLIISTNSFLLEAQNSLLKMFEEPIENTHFFLVVPDVNSLLKTFVSRFYLIRAVSKSEAVDADKFISMPLQKRLDYLKVLLTEPDEEDEEGNKILTLESTRSRALKFLNALEVILHKKSMSNMLFDISTFTHICKVRKFLRMPGSSPKTLLESVAIVLPHF